MSWDYLGDLQSVPGLSVSAVMFHLNLDNIGDQEEEAYLTEQLVPAAYLACEAFCNRNVFPTADTWEEYEVRENNPEAYPPAERVQPSRAPMLANRAFLQAVLLTVGHYHRNREATTVERMMETPLGARALLWPYRKNLGI